MQYYFKEINSENIYAKNIKDKEIINFLLKGFVMYL
jgi:hypothetical protein